MYLFVDIYCFLCFVCTWQSHIDPTAVLFLASDWTNTCTQHPYFPLSLFDLYKSFSAWGLKHTPVQSPSITAEAGPEAWKCESFGIACSFPCKLNHFHNYWHNSPKKLQFCYHLLILMSFQTCMTFFLLWNIKTFWETSVFFSHTMKVSNHQNFIL